MGTTGLPPLWETTNKSCKFGLVTTKPPVNLLVMVFTVDVSHACVWEHMARMVRGHQHVLNLSEGKQDKER